MQTAIYIYNTILLYPIYIICVININILNTCITNGDCDVKKDKRFCGEIECEYVKAAHTHTQQNGT